MPEKNYSKREQDSFRGTMLSRMDNQDGMLGKILDQTSKTNGRVTKLEDKIEDYPEVRKQLDVITNWKLEFMSEIKGMKRVMTILVIVLPTLISTIFALYINSLRQSIIKDTSANVISTLQAEYNIKITQ